MQHFGDLLAPIERRTVENALAGIERAIGSSDRDIIEGWIEKLDAETMFFAERRMDRGIRRALAGVAIDRLERNLETPARGDPAAE